MKKSVANEGSSLVLKTESTPKTAVSKDALTPNSKSKYYKFHNEKRKRTSGETDLSRRLFGGGTDAPVACDDDNIGVSDVPLPCADYNKSFGVKEFYGNADGRYFFKEKVQSKTTQKLPTRRELRTALEEKGKKIGRPNYGRKSIDT